VHFIFSETELDEFNCLLFQEFKTFLKGFIDKTATLETDIVEGKAPMGFLFQVVFYFCTALKIRALDPCTVYTDSDRIQHFEFKMKADPDPGRYFWLYFLPAITKKW